MEKLLKIILLVLLISLFIREASALTILSPQEGQVVYQRDRLTVIVKPDAGEQWDEVLLNIYPMGYNLLTREYRQEIEIPEDTIGTIDFSILAYNKAGQKIKLNRNLVVKLPLNVVLQSIIIEPNPLFLDKLPAESDPDDVRVFGTRDLSVNGVYSDGVKRKLTSSASGTTYKSNNESIVIVSQEGKAIAQGIGRATITVRNGQFTVDIRVIVDPYKE